MNEVRNMTIRYGGMVLVLVAGFSLLAGCESSKDKAARHLQAALELVQKGDPDRAVVEFLNVFKLDANNRAARLAYADLMHKRGNMGEAYAQYQRLIDLKPDDHEALMAAAAIAAELGDWPEAGKKADAALALVADDPQMKAIRIAVDYATAASASDAAGQDSAARQAADRIAAMPDNLFLRRVVIDNLIRTADYQGALKAIDAAEVIFPREKGLYQMRVKVLSTLQDNAGVAAELARMVKLFPDDPVMGMALLRWYVSHDQTDQAEAYLRDNAASGNLEAGAALVNFLRQYRSSDVALAEVDRIIAALPKDAPPSDTTPGAITPEIIHTLRSAILFEDGKQDEAIAGIQAVLATAKPSDQTRLIKVALARMLSATGQADPARKLVEDVLAEDAGQVEAMKLKSSWLIAADKTDDAVALLRAALSASPQDSDTMTLLAQAYGRAGSHDLMGTMLSQAVVASGKAPDPSLRYADFLIADAKYLPAETILIDALRLEPANLTLLTDLGRLYVLMKDWPRATGVADRLAEIATPEATAAAQSLRPAILASQQSPQAAIGYLRDLINGDDANLAARASLIQSYLSSGEIDKAKALNDEMLTRSPKDPGVRFIDAMIKGAGGDSAGAVAGYRDLVAENPDRLVAWMALEHQYVQDRKVKEAEATVDEALVQRPESGDLLMMKADFQQQRQDIDGAIQTYEKLYATNPDNLIVANNLASLLANFKTDPASLDRAWLIARRLNATTEPAFADTYGWIAQLRGNPQEALPYLETAGQALYGDPMVLFHLAETYRALNRTEDARAQYAKVVALVPPNDSRPFVQTTLKQLAQPANPAGTSETKPASGN